MSLSDAHKLRGTPVKRECQKCRAEKVLSTREIDRVYPTQSEAMRIATGENTDATHFCCGCETAFTFVGTVPDRDSPERDLGGELTLSGVM